jgi:hypothetical protein
MAPDPIVRAPVTMHVEAFLPMILQAPIPVLRIFDLSLAKRFYVDWLGCTVDWEHQYEPGFPRYLQVSRGLFKLHLSEHHGDACPGAKLIVHIDDVESLCAELTSRHNPNMRPSVTHAEWNASIMEVIDPFGNRILFNQAL